jgi:hypothetical protein
VGSIGPTLTSRDFINGELRKELDEATGRWGLRVSRAELKAIEPPGSIQDSMEKQMRADRDKRAAILIAEGAKQSAILTTEGEKQAAVLRARGEAEAEVVRAEADATAAAARARGQAQAIATVFRAIHEGNPDQRLLAYKYLEMLPELAQGSANKMWIVPSELGKALEGVGGFFGTATAAAAAPPARLRGGGLPGPPGWPAGPPSSPRTGARGLRSGSGNLVNRGGFGRLVVGRGVLLGDLSRVGFRPVHRLLAVVIVVLVDGEAAVGRVLDVLVVLGDLELLLVVAHIVGTGAGHPVVTSHGTQSAPACASSCG